MRASTSGFSHRCLLHTLMWIRKSPNCKHGRKCPWLTVGLALPPPLTPGEPDKLWPSLFSAPRDEVLFYVTLALGLSRLLTPKKVTVTELRHLCRKGFMATVHMFGENLLRGLRNCSDWLSCSSHRDQSTEDTRTQKSQLSRRKHETKPGDRQMKWLWPVASWWRAQICGL